MTDSDPSTQEWLRRFQAGDGRAAQRLWEKFFDRLVRVAHRHLHRRYRTTVDAEDVAFSAFHTFCHGVKHGRYPQLGNRDDLWRFLVTITLRKVMHVMRDQNRIKRGGTLRNAASEDDADDEQAAVNEQVGHEPSPEFAAQMAEGYDRLIRQLGDEELVQLALWKLEGFTNDEIAAKWGRALRTVERKLQLIRKIWSARPPASAETAE
jgi:DNA-directed RNA polymerase specialized sigma24 family protein